MRNFKEVQKIFYDKLFSKETDWNEVKFEASAKYFIERFLCLTIRPDKKEILEIGCGNGFLTYFLLKNPLHITAVDISKTAIENMKKQFAPEIQQGKLELKCADIIEFLADNDKKYDVIVGSGIIHHNRKEDWGQLFRLAYENLAPGGVVACGPEPNAGGLYKHCWRSAKFFYRLFGMEYDWEVEKGSLDMIPKNLKSALKQAGFQNQEIRPFQLIPHFHVRFLSYIDQKLISRIPGKLSFYITIRGEKSVC